MSGLAKWGSYSTEAAKADAAAGDGDETFMKLKEGRSLVRILPPRAGETSPFRVVRQHFIKPAGNGSPVVFVCPRVASKGRCPACEQAAKLRATGLKIDRDRAWELMPKMRVFANVIDRNDMDAGPKVLGFGKMIYEELVDLRQDPDSGGDFTHPEKGYDIIITRKGTGKNDTSYSVKLARSASPITDDDEEASLWYESMENLDQFAAVKPYEDICDELGLEAPEEIDTAASRHKRLGKGKTDKGARRKRRAEAVDTEGEEVDDDDVPY
jgi:hypothetical protein